MENMVANKLSASLGMNKRPQLRVVRNIGGGECPGDDGEWKEDNVGEA